MKNSATWWQNVHAFFSKIFGQGMFVGNRDRVQKREEKNTDTSKLHDLNKTWRQMLLDDPWRKKLMTHVGLLGFTMSIFAFMFWLCVLYLPIKHPALNFVFAGFVATIPYWIWVGKWNGRIEKKVFEAFKKKFGKHFHLK